MGSEQSHLTGIEIEEKSVEVSDFWSQHSANVLNSENVTNLTVLIGELFVDGPLWASRTPLEKASKNLMIYRHPCIVKYISSWQKSSKFHLAIEEVMPLAHVLSSQNTLQVCIGLHSILKALCFLHEKASVSHNNICTASIYVLKDGSWKLGGMEYLCRFSDLSCDYLKKSKSNRYSKAVDPNEEKHLEGGSRRDLIDVFAYGVLVCEVLKNHTDDEIPSLIAFRDLCKNDLQNINANSRPKLHELLEHDFFNHEFIVIHSFLVELPLKSDDERTRFFTNVAERLRCFPEVTVANQFGSLLLSRMVLLNKTAQEELLPLVLCPKSDPDDGTGKLFTEDTFKKFLVPKLLEIFCVRDAQIRLLLLNHFAHFMNTFSKEELQSCILPELLVGVKDTNDHLVSITLKTLAELVPVLGAATVIGGKRAKLFNDGRPIVHPGVRLRRDSSKRHETRNSQGTIDVTRTSPDDLHPIIIPRTLQLPERPRPDGEEGETSTEELEPSVEEDLDNWEDWDINDSTAAPPLPPANIELAPTEVAAVVSENQLQPIVVNVSAEAALNAANFRNKVLPDINELDIKSQTSPDHNDEFDFFQDMEPVIEASSKYLIADDKNNSNDINSKLNVSATDDHNIDGWGDEEWE